MDADQQYAIANEDARRTLWSATKDVWNRAYAEGKQIGMDMEGATDYADDFYNQRFGLTAEGSNDYSAALVQLAMNPELATPAPTAFPKPTLDEMRAQLLEQRAPAVGGTPVAAPSKLDELKRRQQEALRHPIADDGAQQGSIGYSGPTR